MLLWARALTAYSWKKGGRNAWLGFGFGLVIGVVMVVFIGFSAGYYRGRQAAEEDGPWKDYQRPNYKPDPLRLQKEQRAAEDALPPLPDGFVLNEPASGAKR